MEIDTAIDRLQSGASVALALDDARLRRDTTRDIERELRAFGRIVVWIDLEGVVSGADLAGRIVEGCLPHLDPEELGDVLERVPGHGRLDLEAFAELLMLPERIAASQGKRVVAILDGFHAIERVLGMVGLVAARDALGLRERVAYLFVGSRRLEAMFGAQRMPMYGLAHVVGLRPGGPREAPPRRGGNPTADIGQAPVPAADPLTAALLAWADPPSAPNPQRTPAIETDELWRRLFEKRAIDEIDDDDNADANWRRRRRRRDRR